MADSVQKLTPVELHFKPEAAVSGAALFQSETSTFLTFNAVQSTGGGSVWENVGTALIEFESCFATRFGSPNDEGLPEHPLYGLGLQAYGIWEVLNSEWAGAEEQRAQKTTKRIWGSRGHELGTNSIGRHFIFTFHDSTFECLAGGFKWTLLSSFEEATKTILARLESE
ncbi:MAG: hypothetical protein JNM27_13405 [Leptospirales bacterium]|nr:hypothetical protein [Leptospirales bacterium]